MKISPITNTNISHKGELTSIVSYLCHSHMGFWKRDFKTKSSPAKELLRLENGLSLDLDFLDIACKELFRGKSAKEKEQIRNKYKIQAEKNFNQLTEMMERLFLEHCFLYIKKFDTDKKFHAIINNVGYRYFYDFGEMNLSRNNNDFRDIDVMTKLVNKIKNLKQSEIDEINRNFEYPIEADSRPQQSEDEKARLASLAVTMIITA